MIFRFKLTKLCFALSLMAAAEIVVPKIYSQAPTLFATARAEEHKPFNLFQLLFKRRSERGDKNSRHRFGFGNFRNDQDEERTAPRRKNRRSRSATAGDALTRPQKVEKSAEARKVIVIGDFYANRIASGLTERFAGEANIIIVDKTSGNSGLVREDVKNWQQAFVPLIEEIQPVAVVIAVGMNDRQQMRFAGSREEKLTDKWRTTYESRVDTLVTSIRKKGVQVVWIGLPPVRFPSMNTDYLIFNDIYRSRTEAAGGKFVDVWEGFVDTNGNFSTTGPDVNGQIVRLRLNDGINFTRAGREKLGFYAERDVSSLIGLAAPAIANAPGLIDPGKSGDAAKGYLISPDTTALLPLDSALIDGSDILEGGIETAAKTDAKIDPKTGTQKGSINDLVVDGQSVSPPAGRVDASWGKPSSATTTNVTAAKTGMNSADTTAPAKTSSQPFPPPKVNPNNKANPG